jgi:hypothetical protein
MKTNWIQNFGIVFIIVGTAVTFLSSNLKIIGYIIITIGTILTYLGAVTQNNKATDEIKQQIKITNEEIETLKQDPNIEQKSLNKIDNEFKSWAKDFLENKEAKKLEYDKEKLDKRLLAASKSKEWFKFYDYFFIAIKNLINAYNQMSENPIEYEIPRLPANLFSDEIEKFKASIIFSQKEIWDIIIKHDWYSADLNLPPIEFHFRKPPDVSAIYIGIMLGIIPYEHKMFHIEVIKYGLNFDTKNIKKKLRFRRL